MERFEDRRRHAVSTLPNYEAPEYLRLQTDQDSGHWHQLHRVDIYFTGLRNIAERDTGRGVRLEIEYAQHMRPVGKL